MAHFGRPSPVKNNEFIRASYKFFDINHPDVNKHSGSLDFLGIPANTIVLYITVDRVAGTGFLRIYPVNASDYVQMVNDRYGIPVPIFVEHGRIYYNQTVANDDFDLYLRGYVVQRRKEYRK